MSKDVWKVLDYIYDNAQPELSIAINSNLGTDPRLIQRLIDAVNKLEDKVKQIEIYTSCESIGDQASMCVMVLTMDIGIQMFNVY